MVNGRSGLEYNSLQVEQKNASYATEQHQTQQKQQKSKKLNYLSLENPSTKKFVERFEVFVWMFVNLQYFAHKRHKIEI